MNKPLYKDYVFLCPSSNEVEPIPHEHYLMLMHKQKALPQYAGQHIRVAIFYVTMDGEKPIKAVNATYGLLDFDNEGYASPHAGHFSPEQNRAFYEAVQKSAYEDVDYDPEVQRLRRAMQDEFSWAPSDKEQRIMLNMIFKGVWGRLTFSY